MSASLSAADQAELMEKEKVIMEHQQHLEQLRTMVKTMATRQVTLKRQGRRSHITVTELAKLKPEHTVYTGVGRAFMKTSVNTLIEENSESLERAEAEESRLAGEKQRAAEMVVREETELQKAVEEYKCVIQMVAAMQSRQQQQQQQQQQK